MQDPVSASNIPLERDMFLRGLLRELAGSLQDIVGLHEASGYISVVGAAVGKQIDGMYKQALKVEKLDRQQIAAVLVDLKRRIQGKFYVIEENENHIIFGNSECPFGDYVKGRPSLCMMTSNVFGYIAAENSGYARVEIQNSIAAGDPGCRVVVHLNPNNRSDDGREYFEGVHGSPGA
jgi:predicted ArsR family transcriptional regulator